MGEIVRFPLTRKIGTERHFFFLVSGIPQFNGGTPWVYKSTNKKKVEAYIKPHNNLGVARIDQMFSDKYRFLPCGTIQCIQSALEIPQLQSEE